MFAIATDLDRTLLPNGNQEYDNSMGIFLKVLEDEKPILIYVTGRSLQLVEEAIEKYGIPIPDYLIAEVGTKVYSKESAKLVEDTRWLKMLDSSTPNWDTEVFKKELFIVKGIRLQEDDKQNKFKLSYYVDDLGDSERIVRGVTKIIKASCPDESAVKACCAEATVIYSVDETNGVGLMDIVPKFATKLAALEYLRGKMMMKKEIIIYCGDSGNDILPLTSGYKAVLVRNAIDDVKKAVQAICFQKGCADLLYIAEGYKKLNGYYVSGIIEGLIKHGIISPEYAG